ncbi:lipoprotein, putative [Trichomonas vaginalis G3]|uniref:receptor protein-tyrosine kinase n=1 Tax=Trichomonas vaginalis (strain ATCC PRA-98 / G3) TaxID=412133 RepID=A2FQ23_TRIV3|nr:glycine-rich protein family [Trichomonas vaginalis G3]EAX92987.1 lipoprotein, putative [Trichomonas vaginalis G3]KAI5508109.1 glycine-rich protein family [Trichomonas vaginalis G3]|eukprot:XP_001305917.1 lipoprotein [Trichomonas vaginalis G3]
MISYHLVNESIRTEDVIVDETNKRYIFKYPCTSNSECTDYFVSLPAGVYKFELYGASGGATEGKVSTFIDSNGNCTSQEIVTAFGGNTECKQVNSRGGSGGYISGTIILSKGTTAFFTIGGRGIYNYSKKMADNDECYLPQNMIPGGYGGGGYAANWFLFDNYNGAGSGGGQTCVKFDKNDLWHRVIVSGGGGGSDNSATDRTVFQGLDDGSGGSGGGITAQGYWDNGVYKDQSLVNSSFGFSFGYGESPRRDTSLHDQGVKSPEGASDRPGAGAGWFGGFAGLSGNGGSGGGSSWALTRAMDFPKGNIIAYNSFYENIGSQPYGFKYEDVYFFNNVRNYPGLWEGNGQLILTILGILKCSSNYSPYFSSSILFTFIILGLN